MLARRLALGLSFLASTALAWAEKPNIIPLATTSKWLLVSSRKLPVDELANWTMIPAVDRECGVKTIQLRTYTLYPENESVNVLVEEVPDATAAYGLFTLYRDDSMTPLASLPWTEVGPGAAILRRENKFIRVIAAEESSGKPEEKHVPAPQFPFNLSQLQSLLLVVGGPAQAANDSRDMPGAMPQAGLIQHSEKYLLGEESAKLVMPTFNFDLVGFPQGAEARLADYRAGARKVRVLAVTYPTPQIARQRFGTMQNILQVNKDQGAQTVYGKVTGSYVILVFDADSQASAADLLGRFNSTGYITWNQRYEGDEPVVIQMVRFVLANIIFSFVLIGFALFGGLVFFSTKVAARKWFPHSAWGQPDGNTIIKLNL